MQISETAFDLLLIEMVENYKDSEQCIVTLDQMGYRVGQAVAEKSTVDKPRFVDTLDVIKFICKDFWTLVFKKQVDHLKTNHRGVYVLTDVNFRWMRRMASDSVDYKRIYASFPCGIVRGALAQLGINCSVTVEVSVAGDLNTGGAQLIQSLLKSKLELNQTNTIISSEATKLDINHVISEAADSALYLQVTDLSQPELVTNSDVLILATDQRELGGMFNQSILKLANQKPNVIIAVGVQDEDSINDQQSLISSIKNKTFGMNVVGVRKLGSKLVNIDELESKLSALLSSNIKSQSALYQQKRALREEIENIDKVSSALSGVESELRDIEVALGLKKEALLETFQKRDLVELKHGISDLSRSFHEYWRKTPFYSLYWKVDHLADDLKSIMTENSLIRTEYQMSYASGKLNSSVSHIYQDFDLLLDRILQNENITETAFKREVKVLKENFDAQKISMDSTTDPFLLRNQVATFDAKEYADTLQKQASRLVVYQTGYQICLFLSALAFTHFGVPWSITIPANVLGSALGFTTMAHKWKSGQVAFAGNVANSQNILKERLENMFANEFDRTGGNVIQSSISICRNLLNQYQEQLAKEKKEKQALLG